MPLGKVIAFAIALKSDLVVRSLTVYEKRNAKDRRLFLRKLCSNLGMKLVANPPQGTDVKSSSHLQFLNLF